MITGMPVIIHGIPVTQRRCRRARNGLQPHRGTGPGSARGRGRPGRGAAQPRPSRRAVTGCGISDSHSPVSVAPLAVWIHGCKEECGKFRETELLGRAGPGRGPASDDRPRTRT